MHVRLHQLLSARQGDEGIGSILKEALLLAAATHLDQIDFVESFVGFGLDDIENTDDVLVTKVSKQLDFSQRAKTEHGVIERGDALNGYSRRRRNMDG